MKKILSNIRENFLFAIPLTLTTLIINQQNSGCLDICFFPEGRGFPLPMYNPAEYNSYNANPYYWEFGLANVFFWFVMLIVLRPIFSIIYNKYKAQSIK